MRWKPPGNKQSRGSQIGIIKGRHAVHAQLAIHTAPHLICERLVFYRVAELLCLFLRLKWLPIRLVDYDIERKPLHKTVFQNVTALRTMFRCAA